MSGVNTGGGTGDTGVVPFAFPGELGLPEDGIYSSFVPGNPVTVYGAYPSPALLAEMHAPFQPAELLLARLVAERPAVGASQTARKIWGQAAQFTIDNTTTGVNVNPGKPPQPGGPGTQQVPTEHFKEFSRVVEIVRVTNPDDSTQFVDVERINKITFSGPDLRPTAAGGGLDANGVPKNQLPFIFYEFTFKNPT